MRRLSAAEQAAVSDLVSAASTLVAVRQRAVNWLEVGAAVSAVVRASGVLAPVVKLGPAADVLIGLEVGDLLTGTDATAVAGLSRFRLTPEQTEEVLDAVKEAVIRVLTGSEPLGA